MPPPPLGMGGEWEEGSVAYMCAAAVEADQVPCLGGSGWGWRMGSGCCCCCWGGMWRMAGGERGIWRTLRPWVVTAGCTGMKAETREVES